MTLAEFRAAMPEFGDVAAYPDITVQGWLDVAALLLRPVQWRAALSLGERLFVAHNLTVGGPSAASGGSRATGGLVTDKSVGPVKVSYNVEAGLNRDAGFWNLSTYGTQFWFYMKMAGAGGVQITGPASGSGYPSGPLWG